MRITDLLDKRSISLSGAPTSKSEALDQMVELMAKAVRSTIPRLIAKPCMQERKKAPQVSAKGLPSLMENVTQSTLPDWLPWSSKTALISTHWTEHRFP